MAQVEYRLHPRPVAEIKAEVADLVARRKATQPTTKRTFGSVWKNPPGELGAGRLLELCGFKGHRVGGAVVSPMHANFIENAGGATTADCLALMAESRRRVREQFGVELEHEVVLASASDRRCRTRPRSCDRLSRPRHAVGATATGGELRLVVCGERAGKGRRARARAANVVVPFPRRSQGGRLDLAWLAPSARSLLIAFALLAGAVLAYVAARETSMFAVRRCASRAQLRRSRNRSNGRSRKREARACSPSTWRRRESTVESVPTVAAARFDRAFPHTLVVRVVPERPVAVIRQGAAAFVVSATRAHRGEAGAGRRPELARIWAPRGVGRSRRARPSRATCAPQ